MVSIIKPESIALSFLFQRLKWPVPMVRWRSAKEIRNLLNDPVTRQSTTVALLEYINKCKAESEVCEVLTVIFLTSPDARPLYSELTPHIHCHSLLSEIILDLSYGRNGNTGMWHKGHSGTAPDGFEGDSYFHEHNTAHVPPIFLNNLRKLENRTGLPFLAQWAYEWETLREKVGTRYTRYPYYFDNATETRSGIKGQYWQRMRDIYLSAYLRTLAYAVSVWDMPKDVAEGYCLDMAYGIAGLFDVDPVDRPAWLSDIPEKFCNPDADFTSLIHEIVGASQFTGKILVSLDAPVSTSVEKYGKLTLSAHLVSPDYELPEGEILYEKMILMFINESFELKGTPNEKKIEDVSTHGVTGNEAPVCGSIFPVPFGTWQSDYMSVGLTIPSPNIFPNSEIQCTSDGIYVLYDGQVVSKTMIWNDDWNPSYPDGGSTRAGVMALIEKNSLNETLKKLGRRLAYFIHLRTWNRENDYGEYFKSEKTYFFIYPE